MPFSYSLLLIIVSVFRVSVFVSVSYPLMLRFCSAPFLVLRCRLATPVYLDGKEGCLGMICRLLGIDATPHGGWSLFSAW